MAGKKVGMNDTFRLFFGFHRISYVFISQFSNQPKIETLFVSGTLVLKLHINGTFSQKEYHELTLRAAP